MAHNEKTAAEAAAEAAEKITIAKGDLLTLLWNAAAKATEIGECWDLADPRIQEQLESELVAMIRKIGEQA